MKEANEPIEEPSKKGRLKFYILSALGILLFLVPIPHGETFNIPIGILIENLQNLIGDYLLVPLMLAVVINAMVTLWTYIAKPKVIMESEALKASFDTTILYVVSRIVGAIIIVMYTFGIGPEMIIGDATGATMIDLAISLVSVLFVISFAMPLLTNYGIMEFIGVLISGVVRPLFKLPGRAAINVMTAWLGASNAAVLFTKQQYDAGHYSDREAGSIMLNFSLVSVPFVYIVADLLNIPEYFTPFYLIITLAGIIMAFIMVRIPPVSRLPETYSDAGQQSNEAVPEGYSKFEYANILAGNTAEESTWQDSLKQGVNMFTSVIFDLSPIIIAWGTIALIFVEFTPIFDIISYPMGMYLELFGIEFAYEAAPATLVGFADMFIPPLILSPLQAPATRFIVGGATLLQLIYLTETGAMMIQSDVSIGFKELLIVFIQRTLLAIPLMVFLTWAFGIF